MWELQWCDARVDPPVEGQMCIVRIVILRHRVASGVVTVQTMFCEDRKWCRWLGDEPTSDFNRNPYYLPMPEEPSNE